ncbi:uncharacterized protein [Hetaerina americana]|uniref:uncharacterized protein n=1 Tax=Hetaerina americana TaxID=62018 RepID=UPI003A7F27ED
MDFSKPRLPVLVATSAPANEAELQLYRVMQRASLLAYYDTLLEMGGDDVQQLCDAGEEEFLEIMALVGMASKPLHVRRLQKALQEWVGNPAPFQTPLVPGGPSGPLVFPPSATGPRSMPGVVAPPPLATHSAPPPPTSPGHQALRGHPFLVVAAPQVAVQAANPTPPPPCPPPPPPAVHVLPQSPRPPVSPAAVTPQSQAPDAAAPCPSSACPASSAAPSTSGPSPSHASPGSSCGEGGPPSPPDAPSSPRTAPPRHHLPPAASSQGCWFGSEESSGDGGCGGGGWPPPCSPESPPPGGQPVLLDAQVARLAEAAERLSRCLPPFEPRPHNAKKRICRDLEAVMAMSEDDPRRMDEIRKYAAIYGRFDCKRKPEKPLTLHEVSVNEAAAQICRLVPALLSRRDELFPLARQVVRDSGYQYSKGASHPSSAVCPSEACSGGRGGLCMSSGANGTTLPAPDELSALASHHGAPALLGGKRPRSDIGEGSPTRVAKRLQECVGEVGAAAAEAATSSSSSAVATRGRSPLRSGAVVAAEAGSRSTPRAPAPSEHHRTPIGWCHRRSGRVSSSSSCLDPERPDTDDTDSGGSSPYQEGVGGGDSRESVGGGVEGVEGQRCGGGKGGSPSTKIISKQVGVGGGGVVVKEEAAASDGAKILEPLLMLAPPSQTLWVVGTNPSGQCSLAGAPGLTPMGQEGEPYISPLLLHPEVQQMVRETLMDEGLRVVRELVSGRGRDGGVDTGAASPTQDSFFHENKVIASSGNNIIAVANPALSMSPAIHSPPADSGIIAAVPVALVKREPPSPTYD